MLLTRADIDASDILTPQLKANPQMIDKRLRVPLSPPDSPRMSNSAGPAEHESQLKVKPHTLSEYRSYRGHSDAVLGGQGHANVYSHDSIEPSRQSYKSAESSSGRLYLQPNPDTYSQNAFGDYQHPKLSQGMRPTDLHPSTHNVLLPASPADRLTPHSPDDQQDDDDLIDSAGEDHDDGSERPPMTAAELRAHKRKMKRFR